MEPRQRNGRPGPRVRIPGVGLAVPLLRLLCLLWFWPTFVGAGLTGLVFLVAFLLRDTGLVRPNHKITKQ